MEKHITTALATVVLSLLFALTAAAQEPLKPTAVPRISVSSSPGAAGTVSVALDNPTGSEQDAQLQLTVVDFFQKPVFSIEKNLKVAPGKQTLELGAFPAADSKRFRADLRWRFGAGEWNKSYEYADVDFLESGERRIQRIDSGPWQKLVPAESPHAGPSYPPQGTWEPTTFPLKPEWSGKSHWTWFRQEIPVRPWFRLRSTNEGRRLSGVETGSITLKLMQADYNSHVYLNGHKLGEHMVALTPSYYELSKYWRPGEVNVLEIAVGDMSTTYADFSKDMSYNMITPSVGTGGVPGIWEGVYLISHSPVYVEDVFAMPSTKNGELKVRAWVVNSGPVPATARLRYSVEDEGRRAQSMTAESVILQPGERRMVETVRKWDTPRLWWPHDPHLYRLRAQLAVDGSIRDEMSVRFGFREVRIAGTDLLLNERIFRPFGMTSAGEGPGQRHPNRDVINWWWEKRDYVSPFLMRLHIQPRAAWYSEVADEMGFCLEPESSFVSTVFYDFKDPRFWRNTIRHNQDLAIRDRNSPSIIYWSAGNEVIHAAGAANVPLKDYIGGCKRVIAAMKDVDPTRPIIYEGGMDETAEMVDLHYPRDWYRHTDFPNSTYWLKPGVRTESDNGQTPTFVWKGDRPVVVGEEGQLYTTFPPHDFATFMGDSAYRENFGYAGSARFQELDAMIGGAYVHGYRKTGVIRVSPDCGATGGPEVRASMKPVRTFVEPWDDCFLAGHTINRDITIFHDALVPDNLKLSWEVAEEGSGKPIARGARSYRLDAGDRRTLRATWKAPEVSAPTKLVLRTRLTGKQGELFSEEHKYTVYPADELTVPANVGLYDPEGKTSKALAELGVTGLKPIESLTSTSLTGLSGLIIGEDLPSEPHGAIEGLATLVASGGKVIMLHQSGKVGLGWLPVKFGRNEGVRHTYCFARDWANPLLVDLDDSLLRLWSPSHVVANDSYYKSTARNVIPVIDAGGPSGSGLNYAPMVEVTSDATDFRGNGKGSWVLCQLDVVGKADVHPGARRLLRNILNYACAPAYRTTVPVYVMTDQSSVRTLLLSTNVPMVWLKNARLDLFKAVIVDETGVVGHADALRQFAQQGGTVLVKGLSPNTLAAFSGLFPEPLELVPDDKTKRPVQDVRDPLTSGISNEELYWERRKEQFAYVPEKYVGTPVYSYLIKPTASMTSLYRTEMRSYEDKPVDSRGSGLVKIPVGKGWIVIDQTRWEAAYETQPPAWGNKTPFADGLKRYVTLLVANLGK